MKTQGMTLIELLVSLIIVGILAATGMMLYQDHVYRARRIDAIQTLLAIQMAEENYRTNNAQYGSLVQVWNGVSTTTNGYYSLSISSTSATAYTLTATALSTQANDTESGTACDSLVLSMSSGTETKTPSACWLSQ